MKKRTLVLCVAACVALVSCVQAPTPPPAQLPPNQASFTKMGDSDIYRFVDKEAGVVCWTAWRGGISCLPIKDTYLEVKK